MLPNPAEPETEGSVGSAVVEELSSGLELWFACPRGWLAMASSLSVSALSKSTRGPQSPGRYNLCEHTFFSWEYPELASEPQWSLSGIFWNRWMKKCKLLASWWRMQTVFLLITFFYCLGGDAPEADPEMSIWVPVIFVLLLEVIPVSTSKGVEKFEGKRSIQKVFMSRLLLWETEVQSCWGPLRNNAELASSGGKEAGMYNFQLQPVTVWGLLLDFWSTLWAKASGCCQVESCTFLL